MRIDNASARPKICSPFALAAASSGFFSEIALEATTRSAPAMFSALCPIKLVAPSATKPARVAESFTSDPDTWIPCESMMRAIPLIPAPPIPTKWMRRFAKSSSVNCDSTTLSSIVACALDCQLADKSSSIDNAVRCRGISPRDRCAYLGPQIVHQPLASEALIFNNSSHSTIN